MDSLHPNRHWKTRRGEITHTRLGSSRTPLWPHNTQCPHFLAALSLSLSLCALWGVPTSVQDGKQRFASLFWGPINANAVRVQFSSTKARPGARECSGGYPRPLKDSSSERKFLKKEISSREVPVAFSMATGTLRPIKRT